MTNDISLQTASQGRYWRDAKYDFFSKVKHKFSIAFENNSYPNYTTEKLMDAFLGGSLPIYWGDPKIAEDWNTGAFLHSKNVNELLDMVKAADVNDSIFKDVYAQPIFTDEQRQRHIDNMSIFEHWLIDSIKK
jgi:hypothetical protein